MISRDILCAEETDTMDLIESRTIPLQKFIRIVGNKLADYPSFSLLLGAGCSVYSNIRPASELISEWKTQLYKEETGKEVDLKSSNDDVDKYVKAIKGYDKEHEYSYLFEKLYDTPSQRRVFVEKEIEDKFPSIGYACMVGLFEKGFFSTIFTTNFDDLANEAFYVYPQKLRRPIVCDEDSHISSITVTSNRPKIIKLHGDYLYDNIRATKNETSKLNSKLQDKFKDFAHETGLIVIGYSCGDDSVMGAIQSILDEPAGFKNGIYWCLRKNDEVPPKLLEIINNEEKIIGNKGKKEEKKDNKNENSDKATEKQSPDAKKEYFRKNFIVRIDGFDELMCELASKLVKDFSLVNDTNSIINDAVIKDLNDNAFYEKSNSVRLKEEVNRLKNEAKTYKRLMSSRKNKALTTYNEDSDDEDSLSSKVLKYQLMDAQGKYDEIVKEIDTESPCTNDNFQLFDIKMKALFMLQRVEEAIDIANKLIKYDSFIDRFYINKSMCYQNFDKRIEVIKDGLDKLPNSDQLLSHLALLLLGKNAYNVFTDDKSLIEEAERCYLKCMGGTLTPYSEHITDLFDLYLEENKKGEAENLVQTINKLDSNSYRSIALQVRYWLKYDKEKNVKGIISFIDDNNRCPKYQRQKIDLLKAEVFDKRNSLEDLKKFCLHKPDYQYQKSMVQIASFIYKRFRNIELAITCLENALEKEWTYTTARALFDYYCDAGEIEKAQKIYENKHINNSDLKYRYWSLIKDWQQIITESQKRINNGEEDSQIYIAYTHALLQQKDFEKVISIINPMIQESKNPNHILIINYELARRLKKDKNVDKERIERLAGDEDKSVQIGAEILLGDMKKAKSLLIEMIQNDYSEYYKFSKMFIFNSSLVPKGFLEETLNHLSPICSFTKQEEELIKSF